MCDKNGPCKGVFLGFVSKLTTMALIADELSTANPSELTESADDLYERNVELVAVSANRILGAVGTPPTWNDLRLAYARELRLWAEQLENTARFGSIPADVADDSTDS